MILVKPAFAACYCSCYATRLQLLNAAAMAGLPRGLALLASQTVFWPYLANKQPDWVIVTSPQLAQEPEFVATIQAAHPQVGIVVCVLPGSPAPPLLWPLLRQLEPDCFCTLAELPDCLAALAEKRAYCSSLLAIFSQLAATVPAALGHQPILFSEEFQFLTKCEVGIVREILHGLCRRRIAAALFISPRTVDNHKANIARKLGAAAISYGLTKYIFQHKEMLTNWLEPGTDK